MNKAGEIISVEPKYAIPRGEVIVDCEGFTLSSEGDSAVRFDDRPARLIAASSSRVIAEVPAELESENVRVTLESGGDISEPAGITVGRRLVGDMHIVANPAVDPKDGSLIVTRSGPRGQKLSTTLFRVDRDGFVSDIDADVTNPTGIAFDRAGRLFVTNRADGEVHEIVRDESSVVAASGLGTATGIAFDEDGTMFVGDRAGVIYRIGESENEIFARLEPSVSAYHMAFGLDGRLYVTAPGLSSFDSIYAIDKSGFETRFFKGLGRPQGIAFDAEGNLYVAGCIGGKRGIFRITDGGESAEHLVAGSNVVGLCFGPDGELIVATNESLFSIPTGIKGLSL